MIAAALAALNQMFTPPFRAVLWKTLGLTLALLAVVWVGLDRLAGGYLQVSLPWLATMLSIITGFGLIFGLGFLLAPASMLVAGLYLDELAEMVEHSIGAPQGRALPNGQAIWLAIKFTGVSVLVNLLALLLLLVPGINLLAFFGANAYLFGREYFELAALRYAPLEEVRAMRRKHAWYIFMCGLPIACFLAVPGLNLLTPLFATAFMVRIHHRLAGFNRIDILPPDQIVRRV